MLHDGVIHWFQLTLSNLCRDSGSTHHMEPSDDIRTKFEAWVSSQINNPYFHMLSPTVPNSVSQRMSSPRKESDAQQSMLQTQLTQKTRMRTSFDPELELPKLQKWFLENQHPSRQQVSILDMLSWTYVCPICDHHSVFFVDPAVCKRAQQSRV